MAGGSYTYASTVVKRGDRIVKRDPAAAAEIARQTLHFAEHMRSAHASTARSDWWIEWAYMRELRALQLLEEALQLMRGKAEWHAQSALIRPELTRLRNRQPTIAALVAAVHAAVPEMVETFSKDVVKSGEARERFLEETKRRVEMVLGPVDEQTDRNLWLFDVERRRMKHVDFDVELEGDTEVDRLVRKAANQSVRTRGLVRRAHFLLKPEARCRELRAPDMGKASGR